MSDGADSYISNDSRVYGTSYLPRHEYFHVVQWNYAGLDDWLGDSTGQWVPQSNGFIMFLESSANWAADQSVAGGADAYPFWSAVPDLLGEPQLQLVKASNAREYGSMVFPSYLAQRFGPDAVREAWRLIGAGNQALPAIKQVLERHGTTEDSFYRAFWVANYVITPTPEAPNVGYSDAARGRIRTVLDDDPRTADGVTGRGRPARTTSALDAATPATGHAEVGPGGSSFVDLSLPSGEGGWLKVEMDHDTWAGTRFRAAVLSFGQYPTMCTAPRYLDFDNSQDESRDTAWFPLPKGCTFATLVMTQTSPDSHFNVDVDWTASWQPSEKLYVSGISDAITGVDYDSPVTIYGGVPPYRVDVVSGGIPGLTVGSDGSITGTPGAPQEGTIRLKVTDNAGTEVTEDVPWRITSLPDVDPGVVPVGGSTPPPCTTCGGSWGDPHLTTFDGLAYDEQAAGEVTLVRGDGLEVQARQVPWRNSAYVSVNTAFALNVAGDRVGAYLTADGVRTVVDGTTADLAAGPLQLAHGGTVRLDQGGRSWVATWPDGSSVALDVWPGEALHARVGLDDTRRGNVVGLLGDADGDRTDDLRTADGTVVPVGSTGAPFRDYLDSWRVDDQTSLFDYEAGESTATWTDLRFPGRPLELADLPPDQVAAAREVCRSAGILDQPALDSCALDVALIGPSAASGAMFAAWTGSADSIVRDGGFEDPALGGGFQTFASGTMGAWTVGDVDLVRDWNDAEGQQSVDMSSCAAGWVSQDLPTMAGRRYVVRYALSANPGGPSVKTLRVEIDGVTVQRRDVTSTSPLTWSPEQVEFVAGGALTTLTFRSETGGCYGPALDAVAVVPTGS